VKLLNTTGVYPGLSAIVLENNAGTLQIGISESDDHALTVVIKGFRGNEKGMFLVFADNGEDLSETIGFESFGALFFPPAALYNPEKLPKMYVGDEGCPAELVFMKKEAV
jgi:hypothetical protein